MTSIGPDGQVDVTGTGERQYVDQVEASDVDARYDAAERLARSTGTHLWATMAMWKVDPLLVLAGEAPLLDAASLLQYPRIGCVLCEQPFDRSLMQRRCRAVKR